MTDAIVLLSRDQPTRARLAALQFLTAYAGNTRISYAKDLDILFDWCAMYQLDPLEATRPQLELFGRYLSEQRGNKPPTVHRRLSTIRCFYRACVYDDILERSPAEYLRLPKLFFDDSRMTGLDRAEMSAILAASRTTRASEHALVSLMGLMGLRVTEACSILIENTHGSSRGHRAVSFIGKGSKPAFEPLAVPVARAVDAAAGERTTGPLLLRPDGVPMDRRHAARVITRLAKRAGIDRHVTPHTLRHAYITNSLDAGVPLRDVQTGARHADPRMTMRYDTNRKNFDRHPNYVIAAYIAAG